MCLPWFLPRTATRHRQLSSHTTIPFSHQICKNLSRRSSASRQPNSATNKHLRRTALTNALIDCACVAVLVPMDMPSVGRLSAGDVASEDRKYRRCTLCVKSTSETSWSVAKNALFTDIVEVCRVLQRVPRHLGGRRAFCTDMISPQVEWHHVTDRVSCAAHG